MVGGAKMRRVDYFIQQRDGILRDQNFLLRAQGGAGDLPIGNDKLVEPVGQAKCLACG